MSISNLWTFDDSFETRSIGESIFRDFRPTKLESGDFTLAD